MSGRTAAARAALLLTAALGLGAARAGEPSAGEPSAGEPQAATPPRKVASDGRLHEAPDAEVDLPEAGRRVGVVAGYALVLRSTGELVRARRDKRFETVATSVEDFALDGDVVHLLVAETAPTPGASRERQRKVVRYEVEAGLLTDELAPVPGVSGQRGDHLLWATRGAVVVGDSRGLTLVTASERRALGVPGDRLSRAAGGAFVLAASGDRAVKLRAISGGVEATSIELPVTVRALVKASDGAFAIGDKGVLLKFGEDDRPSRVHHWLADKFDAQAIFLGRADARVCRSLEALPGGLLIETDVDLVVLRRYSDPLHAALPSNGAHVLADGSTGALYSLRGVVLSAYDTARGTWTPVHFREAAAGPARAPAAR